MMYCPKCAVETTEGQNYCRKCGVNMSLVTKAVRIGDTIAGGDSGLLSKIKSVVGDLKLDEMSVQIGNHLDKITSDVEHGAKTSWGAVETQWLKKREKTPEERRAKKIEQGFSSLFGGIVFTIVLYVAGNMMDIQLPPEWVAGARFNVDVAMRLAWLIGLFPVTAGLAQVIAGFSMRRSLPEPAPPPAPEPQQIEPPPSVTEATTARLHVPAKN
jgi:hypothetical protein